ncbi:MAG TPA: hypothetical protein VGJ37_01845 [Pyrinomonadaceae bacterium]|jgi:hypothetical protein
MNLKRRKASTALAALLLFSVSQIGLQVGFAEPNSTKSTPVIPQQIVARLTTRNNQPITVNGQSASSGASIVSGTTLETGADQSATVNVGPLGSVEIAPNTKVVLTFEQGNLKALVISGCVVVNARKNTTGELATEQGSSNKTDPAKDGRLENCAPAPPANPNTAEGGLFGLGWPATIAVISASTAAGLTPLFFQDNNNIQSNPSGSTP